MLTYQIKISGPGGTYPVFYLAKKIEELLGSLNIESEVIEDRSKMKHWEFSGLNNSKLQDVQVEIRLEEQPWCG